MLSALYLLISVGFVGVYTRRLLADPEEVVLYTVFVGALASGVGLFLGAIFENQFGVMRLQAWGLFVVCPAWCLIGAFIARKRRPRTAIGLGALATTAMLIGIDAFVYEPQALEVNRVVVHTAKRKMPLRIAVLADLQTDAVGDYERTAVRRALAEKPDVLLLPGDYVQGQTIEDHERLIPQLRALFQEEKLGARQGAWAVEGNVDYRDHWPRIFDGVGVVPVVKTTAFQGQDFQITALSFDDSFDTGLSIQQINDFHIVLGHGPDFALGKVEADLLVAGHTHGGQVQLPLIGPLLTFSTIPRAWAHGVTELKDNRLLVVSRGVGMERGYAPRMRFNCHPEIVIIDVLPDSR